MILSAILGVAGSPAAAQSTGAPLTYDVLPVGPGGAPVFVGTAEPGATVDLLDGAIAVATGIANERGEWILAAPGPAGNAAGFTVRVTSPGICAHSATPWRQAATAGRGKPRAPWATPRWWRG